MTASRKGKGKRKKAQNSEQEAVGDEDGRDDDVDAALAAPQCFEDEMHEF